ncbi:MAG: heat-inducible transcriptional repressor HrcA [Parvularculales bacterium]
MRPKSVTIRDLNERSRVIFRQIVETYLETGSPVGSRLVSRDSIVSLSPASVRSIMADLEDMGLLFSPHVSAGRLPTDAGLRLFVDSLMEVSNLTTEEQARIEGHLTGAGNNVDDILNEALSLLSGLSHCASLVLAPRQNVGLKHIEFVPVEADRALVVVVTEEGQVENRLIDVPKGLPPAMLVEAANFLNRHLRSGSFEEARSRIRQEMKTQRSELDELTQRVIEAGLATWAGVQKSGKAGEGESLDKTLIVSGHSRLLEDVTAMEDLERVQYLLDDLDRKEDFIKLLELSERAGGIRIFIGSESSLFSLSGSSMIVSPYCNADRRIIGALGVIGPTRLNYARIIPVVDFAAGMIGRLSR